MTLLSCRKQVRIHVNDERVPFYMKVGETGEAFFVFETEADVPADMQTSPLSGPVSDDGRSDNGEGVRISASTCPYRY